MAERIVLTFALALPDVAVTPVRNRIGTYQADLTCKVSRNGRG